ncbi:MAG: helix-turn-helix domain-containing protein [Hyphomonadaceae bacterium]|nr:helix-turn-helix domain-containing protein [Hyphomonadaceae bacterium]
MNIVQWRKQHGVTQDQMADAIGSSRPHLSKIERGTTEPSPDLARRIEAFTRGEVSAASLLGLTETRGARRGLREDAAAFDASSGLTITLPFSPEREKLLRESGIDAADIARAGAEKALKEAEAKAWAESNREAIDAYNIWIEKHGTLAEQFGTI